MSHQANFIDISTDKKSWEHQYRKKYYSPEVIHKLKVHIFRVFFEQNAPLKKLSKINLPVCATATPIRPNSFARMIKLAAYRKNSKR